MATREVRRDERGAVAVLSAIVALVVIGIAAIVVDVGQAYAKRAMLQSNVDLATLAAAAELDGDMDCEDGERTTAEEFLTNDANEVPGQVPFDLSGNADDDTGFIECDQWRVDLWAPHTSVDLGLAKAISTEDTIDIEAEAAAGVFSPDTRVMPAYAVNGCDFGPQTLLDDSPGGATPLPTPSLPGGADDSALNIDTLTPSVIAVDEVTGLVIDGNNALENATHIGFSTPALDSNLHYEYPVTTKAKKKATLASIPTTITSAQDVWYVRVSRDGGNTWSNALPLQVGDAVLECEAGPTDGNFGALLLYRDPDPSTNERLALNMAVGLDFSLTSYPNAHAAWECTGGIDPAVESTKGDLKDGTNCVDTDTGLPASATEAGLLTGAGISEPGSLASKMTDPNCGRPDETINFGGSTGSRTINNDILTCFFTNGTTRIDDLGAGYTGDPVISEDIFDSPRFYWVPVLGKQTSSGGSNRYQIIDFRPAFITDQAPSATQGNPQVNTGGTVNGLGFKSLGGGKQTLRSVKVVFFNVNALPDSVAASHPTMTYLGVGPKIINLIK